MMEIDEETKREKDANLMITRSCFLLTTDKESEKLSLPHLISEKNLKRSIKVL